MSRKYQGSYFKQPNPPNLQAYVNAANAATTPTNAQLQRQWAMAPDGSVWSYDAQTAKWAQMMNPQQWGHAVSTTGTGNWHIYPSEPETVVEKPVSAEDVLRDTVGLLSIIKRMKYGEAQT